MQEESYMYFIVYVATVGVYTVARVVVEGACKLFS